MKRTVPRGVDAYLERLRRRAALLHALRAIVAGAGAIGTAFAAGALIVGPLGAPSVAIAAWCAVAAAAIGVGAWAYRAFGPLRGAGVTRLLSEVAPALPSAARSAYELRRHPTPDASEAMIRAHEARVHAMLEAIPPQQVVRWKTLRHRSVALGAAGAAIAIALLATERGSAGAYALVHPGLRDAGGARIAVAFSSVEARLVFPSYLDRDSTTVADPTRLEVPRGTSIEISAQPRVDAASAALVIGTRTVPMERNAQGRFFARFVAREDAAIALRLQRPDEEWIHDASERTVHVVADEAPRVAIVEPAEDLLIDEPTEIALRWDVSDDVGVSTVDLVVRTPDGEQTRRRIASHEETARPASSTGTAPLDLSVLAMQPGDAIAVWIEARDGDVVSGPNVGRSAELHVTLASEATRREQRLAELEAVLDRGLHALADRLERPPPDTDEAARARFDAVAGSTTAFAEALIGYADDLRSQDDARSSDLAIYQEMAARVRRLLHEERTAHTRRSAPLDERRAVDDRAVSELESDALSLDDLLGRARVEDAAEIARELEQLRREIHSLLAELRRTQSPEARQRLLTAIGRAQQRLQELMQRIAQMGTNVPQEFMNAGEMPTQESADALANLREAVQRGDLEQADRLLGDLERQIDQLARALGQTEQSFVESRFGPRERAMADAMDNLAGLEAEQGQLAGRATERRSRAARRALETLGGRDNRIGRRLAEQAHQVRGALERIDRNGLAGFEQDAYDRARQRLIDTEDALRTGDLGEARRMAEAAAQDMSGLSRDLDLSALMFPGHEGETSADARQARQADQNLRELRRNLDEALPDVGAHLDANDRTQMTEDRGRQREARGATDRLAGTFEEGPDGTPLSPEAGRELREIAELMGDADRALERGDPLESARFAEDASRRLTELRERLENEQQQQNGGGEGGSSMPDFRRPVRIPDADQFEGPMEMRRRVLDAMQEGAPRGYEDAVRRYYEGLLR